MPDASQSNDPTPAIDPNAAPATVPDPTPGAEPPPQPPVDTEPFSDAAHPAEEFLDRIEAIAVRFGGDVMTEIRHLCAQAKSML